MQKELALLSPGRAAILVLHHEAAGVSEKAQQDFMHHTRHGGQRRACDSCGLTQRGIRVCVCLREPQASSNVPLQTVSLLEHPWKRHK